MYSSLLCNIFWPTSHHKTILYTLLLNCYYLHCPVFEILSPYFMIESWKTDQGTIEDNIDRIYFVLEHT